MMVEQFDSREEKIENIQRALGRSIELDDCMNINCHETAAGIPLLCVSDKIYTDCEDSHTIIFGSTGSKKTRLIIMPTVRLLGFAGETMILIDPKAELYDRTAYDLKSRGYTISAINFRDPSVGNCWNPFDIPYEFYKEDKFDRSYEFVNDIVNNIMLDSVSKNDPYWDYSTADLLFGLILMMFDLCKNQYRKTGMIEYNPNMESDCFSDSDVNVTTIIKLRNKQFKDNAIENSEFWKKEKQKNSLIAVSLMGTVTAPLSKTQPSILSTFDQKMRMFMLQENLTAMLSRSDFSLKTFGALNAKHALYIIMPDEKTTYHKLVSLFIKQSYEYLIYQAQQLERKCFSTRINYLLDEFASLPAINDFPAMISAARSRNIRFNIVIQSQSQLFQKYGDDANTIKSNCNNWIFLTSRELSLLRELEALCGTVEGRHNLYSVSRLQHLKKEEGEALLLCKRLYPFLTRLYDIDKYDGYDTINKKKWKKLEMKRSSVRRKKFGLF